MLNVSPWVPRCGASTVLILAAHAATAQVAEQPGAELPTIVVTAQHLNEERSRIETQTGASTYTFTAADKGFHSFTNGATLKTAGLPSITATDKANATITGTESNIQVNAAAGPNAIEA